MCLTMANPNPVPPVFTASPFIRAEEAFEDTGLVFFFDFNAGIFATEVGGIQRDLDLASIFIVENSIRDDIPGQLIEAFLGHLNLHGF